MAVVLRRRVVRWGNSFGLRITKKEAEELGIRAGDEVEAEVFGPRPTDDIERLALFDFKGDYDIDQILEEEMGGDS